MIQKMDAAVKSWALNIGTAATTTGNSVYNAETEGSTEYSEGTCTLSICSLKKMVASSP
jgi:hypothetical protein